MRSLAPDHTPKVLPNADSDPKKGKKILKAVESGKGKGTVPFSAVQGDHLASEFIRLTCGMDTSVLTPLQRLYLPLIDEVFFKQAVLDEQGQQVGVTYVVFRLSSCVLHFAFCVSMLAWLVVFCLTMTRTRLL